MDSKYTKIHNKKKDNLTVTADISNALKTLSSNTGWRTNSTRFMKNMTIQNKTMLQVNKNLMNEQELQRLFHKSKQKVRTQTAYSHQCPDWGNKNVKDFVTSVRFLRVDDYSDKLLTGLPSGTEQDQDLINILFPQEQMCDLTAHFKKNYLVGKIIGQGAYASVRVAVYKPLNKKVAIKVYQKSRVKQTPRKKSLRRQIRILQILNHPNIVQIWDVVQTNNHVNIIMEYLSGISLSSYLKLQPGHKASEKHFKKVIRALADALRHLHERNISHRDIKLQNVIVNEDLSPKLIDFGFSTCIQSSKKTKIFCGTPSYMAPQIVQKKDYRGQPADIWALGVLSYVMITGIFPFKGATDDQLYRKINKADYNKAQLLFSRDLTDLINRMLTIDILQRITAEQILNHSWLKTASNPLLRKTKRVQSSCQYKKKTTTSSQKSSEKGQKHLKCFKKFNQTCKQNLKLDLRMNKQSSVKLNKTCKQRNMQKQLTKCTNQNNLTKNIIQKGVSSAISKKQPLSKFQKTNRILDLIQNQGKKRNIEDKLKSKQRII